MKFDPDDLPPGVIPSQPVAGGRSDRPLPLRASAAQSTLPAWVLESFSLLCVLGGLCFLFMLWRAAAYLIRLAAGGSLN